MQVPFPINKIQEQKSRKKNKKKKIKKESKPTSLIHIRANSTCMRLTHPSITHENA
jgi:hypothetical protein